MSLAEYPSTIAHDRDGHAVHIFEWMKLRLSRKTQRHASVKRIERCSSHFFNSNESGSMRSSQLIVEQLNRVRRVRKEKSVEPFEITVTLFPGHNLADFIDRRRVALRNQTRADRKSTRLNSSHGYISYAVFCLKKKRYIK